MTKRSETDGPNPSGLCMCGCGEAAPLAASSWARAGRVAGKPQRYVAGHQRRHAPLPPPNPSGICQCGCGQPTNPAPYTSEERGYVNGQPMRFLPGHGRRTSCPPEGFNPAGLCLCGCGQRTEIARYSNVRLKIVKGTPLRYVYGHKPRWARWVYALEDRGHDTPCWIWGGSIDATGYGRYGAGSRQAHRVSYEREHGKIPPGLVLHHACEVRACIRPDHLTPMTRADHRRLHAPRIGAEKKAAIRAATGSQRAIAARHGVSQGVVWKIKQGRHSS